jgi:hypothetical protein
MTFYCSKLLSENCNKRKTSFDIIFKCTFKGYYYPFTYFFKVCISFFAFFDVRCSSMSLFLIIIDL